MKLYLIVFVLFNLCFIACKTRCEDWVSEYNLDKKTLPTNTPQTFRFFFERTGDTMVFNTNGVVINIDSVVQTPNESPCNHYNVLESREQVLKNTKDSIYLYWRYENENSNYPPRFDFRVEVKGNNGNFYFSENNCEKIHMDSVNVANKIYRDVYLYKTNKPDTLIYSTTLGIIKIKPGGRIYTLDRID